MLPPGPRSSPVSLAVTISLTIATFALVLALAIGGAYLASWHSAQQQQQRERQQGLLVTEKICRTLDAIATLKPPAGDAATNPSRAYEQQFHVVIDQLRPDLGCTHVPS